MSVSNIQVVTDALREIGVVAEAQAPNGNQGDAALRRLNQMMEMWEEKDIRLDYFAQTVLSDTCPIPPYAELGVTLQLALQAASTFGVTVSPELAMRAEDAFGVIRARAMSAQLPRVQLENRPYGEGQTMTGDILNGP